MGLALPDLPALGGTIESMTSWQKWSLRAGCSFAAALLALSLWLAHYVWPQVDYSAQGTCSAIEIDKTYAAIDEMHDWHSAAVMRVRADMETHAYRLQTLEGHLAEGINLWVDKRVSKKRTAAFACNHAYVRPSAGATLTRLPDVAVTLQRRTQSESEAWKLAQCLSNSAYSARFPDGYPIENIKAIRQLCSTRLSRNIAWEKHYP